MTNPYLFYLLEGPPNDYTKTEIFGIDKALKNFDESISRHKALGNDNGDLIIQNGAWQGFNYIPYEINKASKVSRKKFLRI